MELKNRGISLFPPTECYNPTTYNWNLLDLREQIEPISNDDGRLKTFLLRYEGIKFLPGFSAISPLANQLRLVLRKGKARAT